MPLPTKTTLDDVPGPQAGNEGYKYKSASDMKKEMIWTNSAVSDYDSLVEMYIEHMEKLKTTYIEQDRNAVKECRKQETDKEANQLRGRLETRRSRWRTAAVPVFIACIVELLVMKEVDSKGQTYRYDTVIAKYEKLKSELSAYKSKSKEEPKEKRLLSVLNSLDSSLRNVSPKDMLNEVQSQAIADSQHRKLFEVYEPQLRELSQSSETSTTAGLERLRKHQQIYDYLVEKLRDPQAAAQAAAQDATAKDMKASAIPRKGATLSHYAKFSNDCSAYLEQLVIRESELRKRKEGETATSPSTAKAANATKRSVSASRSQILRWKTDSLEIFDSCIREVEALKVKNSEDPAYQHEAEGVIAKYEELLKIIVRKMDVSPATLLKRFGTLFSHIGELEKRDLTIRKNRRSRREAERRYCNAYRTFRPWLDKGLKELTQDKIQEANQKIAEHEQHYNHFVATGNSGKRKGNIRSNALVPAAKKRRNEGAQEAASLSEAEKVNEEESEDDSDEDSEDEDEVGDTGGDVFDEQDEMWAFALREAIYN